MAGRPAGRSTLPRRFELHDVVPGVLAARFDELQRMPCRGPDLRDRLIDLTVRQARHQSDFYADIYDRVDPETPVDLAVLATLPQVTRDEVEVAGESIRSRYASYAFTSYTRGTTRSRPLLIDRSRQEELYLQTFIRALVSLSPTPDHAKVALVISGGQHGRQLELPSRTHVLPVSLLQPNGFRQAAAVLNRSYPIDDGQRHIDVVAGPGVRLQQLSAYLAALGMQRAAASVESVQTTSTYVSSRARASLEAFWGCRVVDRYSLTELFVGASSCLACGWHHFDHYGVAELVSLDTGAPLRSGRGALLLTGLYPFTQMTPLIRYRPGDLVEARIVGCAAGETGWRFLGRESTGLSLHGVLGPGEFLSAGEVVEALDPLPAVARTPDAGAVPAECGEAGRLPLFGLDAKDEAPRITVEVKAKELATDGSVAAAVRDRIGTVNPSVGELLRRDAVQTRIVGPGSIRDRSRFRI